MPKPKKDGRNATFYLQNEIVEKLEKYCQDTGLSKTVAVERFICTGINEYQKKNQSAVLEKNEK
ncbi:hypothetical protein [Anaerolactibacter massiliensis]|uniref:hypothetical protein n=1 Tax=Anaerolactibacter massiliensis TaxID=2044573 RepID=UPI000CF9335F|nr:hypothetical protein [Anaerolactibacter massiliensis]